MLGQLPGHRVVAFALGKQAPNLLRHLMRRGQVREGSDCDRDLQRGGRAAPPDHPGVPLIAPRPLDHPLIHETAPEGLARRRRQHVGGPEFRERRANGAEGRLQRWWQRVSGRCAGLCTLLLSGFRLLERLQRPLPRVFQCGGDMPMRRIDVAELALTIGGCVAPALERLRVRLGDTLGLLLPLGQGLCLDVELHGRKRLQKCVDHAGSDRISRNVLTDRHLILLPHGGTEGAGAPLILHPHRVAAGAAVDPPVQQGVARAGDAAGFVAVLCSIIACEQALHLVIRFPANRGRGDVRDAEAPLRLGQTGDRGPGV